ncbi:MAG: hypothetical protein IRZ24_13685 [Thermogemmatispora sp.]|uniref:hypothetical protein n=1 Tax=Thermogemmatispora sp. TaxID=1968838 RepID=UPI001D67AB9C|nr:hypothetical protein [Thermogemmatispora sp.]MBX5451115.1 hypothetical protein [Thermogemmatispora sp.]
MTQTSAQRRMVAPSPEDIEKLTQLREIVRQEAATASPFMASLWETLHAHVSRAHLRAQRALARAERSAVLQAAKAARTQHSVAKGAQGQGEETQEESNG